MKMPTFAPSPSSNQSEIGGASSQTPSFSSSISSSPSPSTSSSLSSNTKKSIMRGISNFLFKSRKSDQPQQSNQQLQQQQQNLHHGVASMEASLPLSSSAQSVPSSLSSVGFTSATQGRHVPMCQSGFDSELSAKNPPTMTTKDGSNDHELPNTQSSSQSSSSASSSSSSPVSESKSSYSSPIETAPSLLSPSNTDQYAANETINKLSVQGLDSSIGKKTVSTMMIHDEKRTMQCVPMKASFEEEGDSKVASKASVMNGNSSNHNNMTKMMMKSSASANQLQMTPPPLLNEKKSVPNPNSSSSMAMAPNTAVEETTAFKYLSKHRLNPDFARKYRLGDQLGVGAFGFVVTADRIEDGKEVAVKFIIREKVPMRGWTKDEELSMVVPREVYILRRLRHPNIIEFYEFFEDFKYFYLVMELHGTSWVPENRHNFMKTKGKPILNSNNNVFNSPSASITSMPSIVGSPNKQGDLHISNGMNKNVDNKNGHFTISGINEAPSSAVPSPMMTVKNVAHQSPAHYQASNITSNSLTQQHSQAVPKSMVALQHAAHPHAPLLVVDQRSKQQPQQQQQQQQQLQQQQPTYHHHHDEYSNSPISSSSINTVSSSSSANGGPAVISRKYSVPTIPIHMRPLSGDETPPPPPATGRLRRRASCDLFEMIDVYCNLNEDVARKIFRQIVDAVHYMHSKGIVHRDIKDENIVIDANYRVKLIDYGSAALIPQSENGYFDRFYGTIQYAAPEILTGHKYRGPEAEVWSLGVLLFTIIYGENPFRNQAETIQGDFIPPFRVSDKCHHLMRIMMEKDISMRATMDEVKSHPWLNVYDEADC